MKDIKINTFIPENISREVLMTFGKNIPEIDAEFEASVKSWLKLGNSGAARTLRRMEKAKSAFRKSWSKSSVCRSSGIK